MKCKDCAVSKLVTCPKCGEEVILCGESNDLVGREFWDSDLENKSVRCDGIIES